MRVQPACGRRWVLSVASQARLFSSKLSATWWRIGTTDQSRLEDGDTWTAVSLLVVSLYCLRSYIVIIQCSVVRAGPTCCCTSFLCVHTSYTWCVSPRHKTINTKSQTVQSCLNRSWSFAPFKIQCVMIGNTQVEATLSREHPFCNGSVFFLITKSTIWPQF